MPLLAAEVVSPTNTAEDMEQKLQEYFAAGVRMVWVVYPVLRRVYVYESLTRVRILTETDDLDGDARPRLPRRHRRSVRGAGQADMSAP